jgi:hypothetical protein
LFHDFAEAIAPSLDHRYNDTVAVRMPGDSAFQSFHRCFGRDLKLDGSVVATLRIRRRVPVGW